jgi:hypothetical protein
MQEEASQALEVFIGCAGELALPGVQHSPGSNLPDDSLRRKL